MKLSSISVSWPEQFCSVLVKSGCLNNLSALSGPRFVLVSSVASTISVSFLVFSGIVSLVGSTISLQQAFGMLMSNDFVMDVINWWLSLTTSWWSQRFWFVSVVVSSLVLALSLSAWLSHLGARSGSRFIVVRFIKHCEFSLTFVIWLFWQYWCRGIVSQQLYFLPIPHKQVNKKMPLQIGKLRELGGKGTRLWIIHELRFENPGVKINPQYKSWAYQPLWNTALKKGHSGYTGYYNKWWSRCCMQSRRPYPQHRGHKIPLWVYQEDCLIDHRHY